MLLDRTAIASALFNGLFAPEATTSTQCPTDKCHWPAFETLGICCRCEDTTDETALVCDSSGQECNVTTSNGYRFRADFEYGPIGPQAHFESSTLINSIVHIAGPKPTEYIDVSGLDNDGNILNMTTVRFRPKYSALDSRHPQTYQCGYRWCLQSYAQTASVGDSYDQAPSFIAPLSFPNCTHFSKVEAISSEYGSWGCTGTAHSPSEGIPEMNITTVTGQSSTHYVHGTKSHAIASAFKAAFNTSIDIDTPVDGPLKDLLATAVYNLNEGDIPATLDSIARGLTDYVRRLSPNSTEVQGVAYYSEVYVEVKWAWLILPASLVLLSSGLLAYTVTLSPQAGKHVWKSSITALFFHRLEGQRPEDHEVRSLKQLDDISKKTHVRLAEDAEGNIAFIASQLTTPVQSLNANAAAALRSRLSLQRMKRTELPVL